MSSGTSPSDGSLLEDKAPRKDESTIVQTFSRSQNEHLDEHTLEGAIPASDDEEHSLHGHKLYLLILGLSLAILLVALVRPKSHSQSKDACRTNMPDSRTVLYLQQ